MEKESEKFIQEHIKKIIEEFDFENRKRENPEACICFKDGKCHKTAELNCFFCYCPEYDCKNPEGECKIKNKKGRLFVKGDKKIWDCSDCDYPHRKEIVEKYLKEIFGIN